MKFLARHAIQLMNRGTVVLVLSSLAACDSTTSSLDASTVEPVPTAPTAVTIIPPTTASDFYQTVVSGERGHVVVEVTPITLAQEELENAARTVRVPSTVQSIVQDAGCGNSSFWLYDQFNGIGNRICFVAGGESLDFAFIPRKWRCYGGQCQAYAFWNLNYGSYWPGVNAGELTDDAATDASLSVIMPFPAWGPRMNFDMSPHQLRQLRLF